jgi:hypothetical protein
LAVGAKQIKMLGMVASDDGSDGKKRQDRDMVDIQIWQ